MGAVSAVLPCPASPCSGFMSRMAGMEDSTEFKPAIYHQHHTQPEPSSRMRLLKGDEKSDVAKCFTLSGVGISGSPTPPHTSWQSTPTGSSASLHTGKGPREVFSRRSPSSPLPPCLPPEKGLPNPGVCARPPQLCLTLCNRMDYSQSGSSVHGIFQARILEWVAMPSSRKSS